MGFNMTSEAVVALPQQHSAWHSPVPYLFGGLAAMLGLIAFALVILACSYWKLSGYLEGGHGNNDSGEDGGDVESGDSKAREARAKVEPVFEEKIVVIMAGDEKPTFLATPRSSRASTFGSKDEKNKGVDADDGDDKKVEDGDAKVAVACEKEHNQDGRIQQIKNMRGEEES